MKGLKYNLLRISQLCNSDLDVRFKKSGCIIEDDSAKEILTGSRDNVYMFDSVKGLTDHIFGVKN